MDAYNGHVSYPEMCDSLEYYFNSDIMYLIVAYMDFELTVFLASNEFDFLELFEQFRIECGDGFYKHVTAERLLNKMFYNTDLYVR